MATMNPIGSNKPIDIEFGGTELATITDHALLVGSGVTAITPLAVGATGELLIGNTGADPSWSATPAVTSLTATTVYGTTFDTNVAAAGVTLSGTTLSADGTDADININITAKGVGQVIIDDLQLTTDLAVSEGGTGVSTLTDHGVLVGSGAAAITALAVGTDGQVLLGSSAADPVFATLASADGTITFTPGAGTLDIAGTDATEAQQGVVELATDAEAIAGADTVRAIVPSSLAAKLGTQTQYALVVGAGSTAALSSLAVGATGEVLIGNTGANPSWSATPSVTSLTATTVYGTTFDTNVAAAGVTLAGTSLIADGTDVDIDINITAKGAGQVIIDDLQLTTDLAVTEGGTGVSTLTDHGVLVGSGAGAITALAVGTDGQVLLGSSAADPVFATLASAGSTIAFTPGAGTLNLETGSAVATSAPTDSGTATPSSGALTIAGGTNINTAGAGSTVTVNLDAAISGLTSVDIAAGGRIGTATSAGNTLLLQAYDVDGAVYVTFATLTANNDPAMNLETSVTMGGNAIYYATGTDIPITDGGTGVSTITAHALIVGDGTNPINELAVGATGEILIGNTGADPSWSATPAVTSLTATTVYGTTFDTNVAAAGVTLAGTSLIADGTDADIDINITAKGTGQVVIDDLQLTTDLAVTEGGTGASSLTDHGVLVGSGTAAVTALAVGTDGQVLVGSSGADPVFATVASADGSIEVTGGAGTIDLAVTGTIAVNNQTGTTYELVLADNGKIVTCTNAAAITVTIPVNADVALPIGSNVLISQNGAGTVTLAPEGGVTLRSRGSLLDTAGQYAVVSATKIATDEWIIGGDLA